MVNGGKLHENAAVLTLDWNVLREVFRSCKPEKGELTHTAMKPEAPVTSTRDPGGTAGILAATEVKKGRWARREERRQGSVNDDVSTHAS